MSSDSIKVLFDGYKLAHKDTGLYHFTAELIRAIENGEPDCALDMEYLLPPSFDVTSLGVDDLNSRRVRFYNKFLPFRRQGANVVHNTYQGSSLLMPCGAKRLLTVHDLNFLYEKNGRKLKKYLNRLRSQVKRADVVVCISEFTKSELAANVDMTGKRVEVIYNGCNLPSSMERPADAPAPHSFLFGVGTMLPKKNWHTLPQILVGNDYKLLLAGKPSPYCDKIKKAALQAGVASRVILLGSVSEGQKHWYMEHCAAFLFPSLAEGFGLPVVEAMYHKRPVFISNFTSLPEIGGAEAYYFTNCDDGELMRSQFEAGMSDFKNDAGRAQRLYDRALGFSWLVAAQKYIKIYKSMV